MKNRLSTIEDVIASVIDGINGEVQPNGYKYHTSSGQINIEDETTSDGVSRSLEEYDHIDYLIEQEDGEENDEWGEGANVYTNITRYIITARVKNIVDSPTPKKDIKEKCDDVLSDLKYAFSQNVTLDGNAEYFHYSGSRRAYGASGDEIRTADLLCSFTLKYGQEFNNPDIAGCN